MKNSSESKLQIYSVTFLIQLWFGSEFGDFSSTAEPDEEKGGVKLTPYVTYNCLSISEDGMADVFMSSLRTFWTCDICEMRLPLTFQEKTAHRQVRFEISFCCLEEVPHFKLFSTFRLKI